MTRSIRRSVHGPLLLVLFIAACSAAPSSPDPAGTGTLGGLWRLEAGTLRGTEIVVVEGNEPTLDVDRSEVGGNTGCNIYGGSITVDGNRVQITVSQMTERGCLDQDLMAAEIAFVEALNLADRVVAAGDTIELGGPGVELRFRFVPPIADAQLIGGAWRLDSLITGDAVSSTMGDAEGTLELSEDGRLAGFTGCRTFDGRYELAGTEVRVTQLTNDDRACQPALVPQDEHVLRVIGGGFAYRIDGTRLTLAGSGGLGLGYRAEQR